MTARPDILVYSHQWHLTRSDSTLDHVVMPLKQVANVVRMVWPSSPPSGDSLPPFVVFCQMIPKREWLIRQTARIIWVPMWDDVRWWTQRRWDALPKTVRVVAFSDDIAQRAKQAGLSTLQLRFYKNPAEFPPPRWDERVLLYWNRTGLLTQPFLSQLCDTLQLDRLIYHPLLDPNMPQSAGFTLPATLGRTRVETLPHMPTRELYWQKLREANIFVAPRRYEGIGMSVLEALASGCAVLAHDAPAMNEYITHGEDGFLFKPIQTSSTEQFVRKLGRILLRTLHLPVKYPVIPLSIDQDWPALGAINLQTLGQTARERHFAGYERWQASLDDYARFVLES